MKEKAHTKELFSGSGCLNMNGIQKFSKDELNDTDKLTVENHLAECEMCRDAVEGMNYLSDPSKLEAVVEEINENLRANLPDRQQQRKNINSNRMVYFLAAASIIILLGVLAIFRFILSDVPEKTNKAQVIFVDTDDSDLPRRPIPKFIAQNSNVERKHVKSGNDLQKKENNRINKAGKRSEPPSLLKLRNERSIKTLITQEFEKDVQPFPETIDIASTQPIAYFIDGIVVYDNGLDLEGLTHEYRESQIVYGDLHFFNLVDKMPELPGGLNNYLSSNLKYPREAREQKIQGRLFISFIVEIDGNVSNVNILRGLGGGCDKEALRAFENMPEWIPAMQDGQPVRVQFNLPVTFKLR